MIKSNKKAQFYIFVAILLCISAYGLLSTTFAAKDEINNNNLLSSNYMYEAKNIINNAIYARDDVVIELDEFTKNFIIYSKTKNVNFQVVYLLKYDNKIRVANYLKDEINITNSDINLKKSEFKTLNLSQNINLLYDGATYNYTFTNDSIEFKTLIITI